MPNPHAGQKAHSAEYFGESRDYWWNDDFLSLVLRRWNVAAVHSLLDVGCGLGHWSRAWARVLPPGIEFTGVDREATWIAKAKEAAAQPLAGNRFRFQVGEAEALPFPENSFDFVTCQTLLIHVADVRIVLSEMVRVTRPGGLVVAAEPNNAALPVLEDALAAGLSVEEAARLMRFHLTCLRGKASLGLGDETIGRVLPNEFKQAGLEQISVCQNEKSCPLVPPYTTARERALVQEITDWAQRDFWIWNRADALYYFVAGGSREQDFPALWELAMSLQQRVKGALAARKYISAGGGLFYLVAGRKPGSREGDSPAIAAGPQRFISKPGAKRSKTHSRL